MAFQSKGTIVYSQIFDDYETVDIKELLKDIPTRNSIQIISYFLAQLHTTEQDSERQIRILKMCSGILPSDVYHRIENFITLEFNFINNISGLILIEELLVNANELAVYLTPKQDFNLLKAYLYYSQQWIDKQRKAFDAPAIPAIKPEEYCISIFLSSQLPIKEILDPKDFMVQYMKAKYFFEFCEKDQQFKDYLDIFLKEYKLDPWRKYLCILFNLLVKKIKQPKIASVLNVSDEYPSVISFLDALSVDPTTFKKSDDFLSLREKPVYKISNNNYVFLNLNFLIDKFYQGIQFDFSRVLEKQKKVKNFLSILGEKFAEPQLFYKVMESAFEKSNYVKCNGKEIKKVIPNGEPDYYMRDKAKVYLFEFKNVFLSAKVKHSYDYKKIKDEIFIKMVENEDGVPKGVTQLVKLIEKIKTEEFEKFDKYDLDTTIIYPVIVYTDHSFNLEGINYILNQEFRRQLKKEECAIKDTSNIKDIILINLDIFIKYQDLFRNKTIKLNNCFNKYYECVKNPQDKINPISTFNMFMEKKTSKLNYDFPKMLEDELGKCLDVQ